MESINIDVHNFLCDPNNPSLGPTPYQKQDFKTLNIIFYYPVSSCFSLFCKCVVIVSVGFSL